MIIRGKRPDRGFTILDNAVIRDSRLSLRARGLLALLLSYPDDWRTDAATLARQCPEGRDAIRSAMKELRGAGYMVQGKRRNELGQWTTVTVVYDRPQSSPNPQVGPGTDIPASDEPGPADQGLYEDDHEDCYEEDQIRADAPASAGEGFEQHRHNEWRDNDRARFTQLVGGTLIDITENTHWKTGRFSTDSLYDALRKPNGRRQALRWPGRFLDHLDSQDGLQQWLDEQAIEPVG